MTKLMVHAASATVQASIPSGPEILSDDNLSQENLTVKLVFLYVKMEMMSY